MLDRHIPRAITTASVPVYFFVISRSFFLRFWCSTTARPLLVNAFTPQLFPVSSSLLLTIQMIKHNIQIHFVRDYLAFCCLPLSFHHLKLKTIISRFYNNSVKKKLTRNFFSYKHIHVFTPNS